MRVSEIRVKRIRVNQGLGVYISQAVIDGPLCISRICDITLLPISETIIFVLFDIFFSCL